MKACIADDDFGVRTAVCLTVESLGYEVVMFNDGESLMTHLLANPKPDLIVTDYRMPRKDGLQVLREIRDAPKLKDLTVVVHTATETLRAAVESAGGIFASKGGEPDLDAVLKSLSRS